MFCARQGQAACAAVPALRSHAERSAGATKLGAKVCPDHLEQQQARPPEQAGPGRSGKGAQRKAGDPAHQTGIAPTGPRPGAAAATAHSPFWRLRAAPSPQSGSWWFPAQSSRPPAERSSRQTLPASRSACAAPTPAEAQSGSLWERAAGGEAFGRERERRARLRDRPPRSTRPRPAPRLPQRAQ